MKTFLHLNFQDYEFRIHVRLHLVNVTFSYIMVISYIMVEKTWVSRENWRVTEKLYQIRLYYGAFPVPFNECIYYNCSMNIDQLVFKLLEVTLVLVRKS